MWSSLSPTKKYILAMFFISCVMLEVFTLVLYNQSKESENSNEWVIHSYEVLRQARLVMVDAIDLASNEQGYILTGYSNYLSNYNTALVNLNKRLDVLSSTVSDNDDQRKRIDVLNTDIEKLKRITIAHIAAVKKGQTSVYTIRADGRATQNAISEIRAAFDAFSYGESQLLEERTQAAKEKQTSYVWTLIVGGLLGLGALGIANLIIFSLVAKNARTERKIRKNEELFASILHGINDGVYEYSVPEDTVHYSTSYESMLGYELKSFGRGHDHFYHLVHPDDLAQAQEAMRAYMAREIPTYHNVFRVRHRDGQWVWLMSRGIGIWNDKGEIQRLIGTHTDITVEKKREEELNYFISENQRQQEELALAKEKAEAANQAKSDFLATMSHEIRTPMNSVIGLSHLLLKSKLDDKQKEMAKTLQANADILLRLVNDLLDISRIESGQMELEERAFTFEDSFETLRSMFKDQMVAKGLKFSIHNQIKDVVFVGDITRVQQILVNLVGNALKFTAEGEIDVTARYEPQKDDIAEVIISVSDTGVGIPPEKLETIFEKFVQADQTISRRFGGTGLGLSICRSMALLMGGDISAERNPVKGSTFTVRLRLRMQEQKELELVANERSDRIPTSTGTVLIVEDYAPNVMVASMMLEHLGYYSDVASNGATAIKKIEEAAQPYVAILMDVQMQDMDGFAATRKIRIVEKDKNFRHFIIGVTAHALAGDRDHCLEAGMDDYMSKPINPDLLARKLAGGRKAA